MDDHLTQWGDRMYFLARYSIAIAVVFGLAACVPMNIGANYSLSKAKASNHGLMIGSMSVESLDELQPVQFTILFNDEPERGGGQNQVDVFSGCNMRHFGEVSFGDECGKIVAFDLPAGTYYITSWDLLPGSDISQSPAHWDAVPFTIEAGRATYVGNIHLMRRANVTDANGSHPISRIWPVVTDRSQRD